MNSNYRQYAFNISLFSTVNNGGSTPRPEYLSRCLHASFTPPSISHCKNDYYHSKKEQKAICNGPFFISFESESLARYPSPTHLCKPRSPDHIGYKRWIRFFFLSLVVFFSLQLFHFIYNYTIYFYLIIPQFA